MAPLTPVALRSAIAAMAVSDTVAYRNAPVLVQRAFANVAAASTDAALVAAVAGKKLLVLVFRLHAGGTATAVTFNSKGAGAGVAISETFDCNSRGGRADGFSPIGHFVTATGEGLSVTTGAGSTVGIGVAYLAVDP